MLILIFIYNLFAYKKRPPKRPLKTYPTKPRSNSSSFLTACFKCLLGTTIKKKTIFIQEITSFLCDWDTTPAFARLSLYHLPKLCYNMFAIKKKTLAHVMAYQSHKSVRGVPFRSTLFVYSNTTKKNQKSNLVNYTKLLSQV